MTSWQNANADCREYGGYLTSIADQPEMEFIQNYITNVWKPFTSDIYIGESVVIPFRKGEHDLKDNSAVYSCWSIRFTNAWRCGRRSMVPLLLRDSLK